MRHSMSQGTFGLFVPPPTTSVEPQYNGYEYGGQYGGGGQYENNNVVGGIGMDVMGATWGAMATWNHSGDGVAVSDVCVDPHQDLVWSGTSSGHVAAHEVPKYSVYTAFVASKQQEVRHLIPQESCVVTVGQSVIRSHSRTGIPKSTFSAPEKTGELFAATSVQSGKVMLGGSNSSLFMFDVESNRLSLQMSTKSGCTVLQSSRNAVYGGQMDGTISVLDPRALRTTSSLFSGYAGGIQDLDTKDKLLCCSGYATDRQGRPYLDGVVRVFDLRMMRAVAPVGFAAGAYKVKFHPVFSGTMILMAQNGHLQLCDAGHAVGPPQLYQVDTGGTLLSCMSVASTGESIVLGDEGGYVHQWADRDGAKLNIYPRVLEREAQIRQMPLVLPDEEQVPLSLLDTGVWALRGRHTIKDLLSMWPSNMWFSHPRGAIPVPPAYVANLQPPREGDFIQYSHVPPGHGLRRYQHPWTEPVRYVNADVAEEVDDLRTSVEGLSVRSTPVKGDQQQATGAAAAASSDGGTHSSTVVSTTSTTATAVAARLKPPGIYQQKIISYSRLGVTGFNFSHYNRTPFSGIENVQDGSHVNAVLQLLFFMPDVRRAVTAHLCEDEFCLSCELSFLFSMLERSHGIVCQASNLLRVLDHLPAARQRQLVGIKPETFTDQTQGIALLERYLNLFLDQLAISNPTIVPSLLEMKQGVHTTCRTCGRRAHTTSNVAEKVKIQYPTDTSTQLAFGALLGAALTRQWTGVHPDSEQWCDGCGNKQPSGVRVAPATLPRHIFAMSCLGSAGTDQRMMWKSVGGAAAAATADPTTPLKRGGGAAKASGGIKSVVVNDADGEGDDEDGNSPDVGGFFGSDTSSAAPSSWVPSKVLITVDNDTGLLLVEEMGAQAAVPAIPKNTLGGVFKLSALLCHVHDPRHFPGPGHSVLHQRIDVEHTDDKNLRSWYLFNDFQVIKTSAREALSFDGFYKNAVMLVLTRIDGLDDAVAASTVTPRAAPSSPSAFFAAPLCKAVHPRAYTVASMDDLPKPGELLPIDAEFVSLSPEVHKTLPSGASVLVRPMHLALARVSILRQDGRVLSDDYIQACDPIDNYLTRYSGLKAGDLDRETSTHTLVKLKTVYLKLLWLIERGCVFVGHGLSKDFRILNIFVPANQIQDTVDLFHLPNSRRISLRFLASYLLDLDIQADTHDSIEDAQTAMAVYQKYQEMVLQGDFDEQLQKLYDTGRATSWMVSQLEGGEGGEQ